MKSPSLKYCLLFLLSAALITIISCSKGSDKPDTPPSTQKKINSVEFKMADNPALNEDIVATITGENVSVKFPAGFSLNGLIPTINFTGASISPANRTAQNFTNPVIYRITAEDGSVINYGFNVVYRVFADTAAMIINRWGVLKDSVTNTGYSFPNGGGTPSPGVYIGVPNDYYDFKINGSVSVFENNNSATAPYQILPNGRISITTSFNYECAIQYLSATRMTLYWHFTNGSGGVYTRTLYLKK